MAGPGSEGRSGAGSGRGGGPGAGPTDPGAGGRLLTERLYGSTRPGLPRKPRRSREALQDESEISPKPLSRTKPEAENVLKGFYFRNLFFFFFSFFFFFTGFCHTPLLPSPGFPRLPTSSFSSSDWQLLLQRELSHPALPALARGVTPPREGTLPITSKQLGGIRQRSSA